jgi:hypothetical protein
MSDPGRRRGPGRPGCRVWIRPIGDGLLVACQAYGMRSPEAYAFEDLEEALEAIRRWLATCPCSPRGRQGAREESTA